MPQIVVAAVASAAGSFVAGSVIGLTAGTIAYGVVSGLTSAIVGAALSNALGLNKPPKAPTFTAAAQDRQQMIRSPAASRAIVYGEAVMSGPIVFAASTGTTNEYLHVVIPLSHGASQAIGDVWFGDERVGSLDGSGNVTNGRFSGKMRIKKHLGASDQAADSDLVSEVADWTSAHRLRGITYIYVRVQYDSTVYPYGLENIKAEVKGRLLYDPRTSSSAWSDNWALVVRDYLSASYGLAAASGEIDSTAAQAAANICDERVRVPSLTDIFTADAGADTLTLSAAQPRIRTGDGVRLTTTGTLPTGVTTGTTYYAIRLGPAAYSLATSHANALAGTAINLTDAGSGTHTLERWDQPRYACNGSVDLGGRPIDNLRGLLSAALGQVVYTQGVYQVHAAAYATPTVTLTEDDLRGPLTLRARPDRQSLYNGVRGTFVSPENFWQPADFPPVTNGTYEAQDGDEQILKDLELPYTIDSFAAQRLAKIALERARQGITVAMPCKLTAFKVRCWDVVSLTIAHLGWSAKAFRVTRWTLQPDGGVDLELQEEASASYSWSSGEATVVDPAPDTTLPSLYVVAPPTSLSVASGATHQLVQADGLTLCRLYATWTASADALISHYELAWKLTADSDYQSAVVPSAQVSAYIGPVESGSDYHVRVRAVRQGGALSAWEGPDTIAASSDATAVSVDYDDVTGTKPPADADNTVDAVEAGATVTSGGITFSAGGAIKGGQTGYNTGTGWFLGYSGGAYKFSIGNPAGNYMLWDGSNLTITGNVTNVTAYTAGTNVISEYSEMLFSTSVTFYQSYNNSSGAEATWQALKSGTITCAVCAWVPSGTWSIRVMKNGAEAAVMTGSNSSRAWSTTNVAVTSGDKITFQYKSISGTMSMRGVQIRSGLQFDSTAFYSQT